jgi:hypothetical protein
MLAPLEMLGMTVVCPLCKKRIVLQQQAAQPQPIRLKKIADAPGSSPAPTLAQKQSNRKVPWWTRILFIVSKVWFIVSVGLCAVALCNFWHTSSFLSFSKASGYLFACFVSLASCWLSLRSIRRHSNTIYGQVYSKPQRYFIFWALAVLLSAVTLWALAIPFANASIRGIAKTAFIVCFLLSVGDLFSSRVFLLRRYAVVFIGLLSCFSEANYPFVAGRAPLERLKDFGEVIADLKGRGASYFVIRSDQSSRYYSDLQGDVLVLDAVEKNNSMDYKIYRWESQLPKRLLARSASFVKRIVVLNPIKKMANGMTVTQHPSGARSSESVPVNGETYSVGVTIYSWPDKDEIAKSEIAVSVPSRPANSWDNMSFYARLSAKLEKLVIAATLP